MSLVELPPGPIQQNHIRSPMALEYIGKVLFPRLPPWQRRRKINTMLIATLAALFFAALVVGLLLLINSLPA